MPEAFARDAVKDPNVSYLTEEEFEDFYNSRTKVRLPEVKRDEQVIAELEHRVGLPNTEDPLTRNSDEYKDAMDPDKPHAGRRRQVDKRWATFKAARGITIHRDYKKRR